MVRIAYRAKELLKPRADPPLWAFLGLLTFMSMVPQNRLFCGIGGLTCVPDAPVEFWRFGGHSLCDQRYRRLWLLWLSRRWQRMPGCGISKGVVRMRG